MGAISYETFDVFTEVRFTGNPLAVVRDARTLTEVQMQHIAAEFNYSESAFILPPEDSANTARVRIFTPANEVPFAGHPNIGTAFALGLAGEAFGKATGDIMRFEEKAGLVNVELQRDEEGQVIGARVHAPQALTLGPEISPETICACLSLTADDIVTAHHRPVAASVGLPFAITELASLEALGRIRVNIAAYPVARDEYQLPERRFSTFVYVRIGPDEVRARMFAPLSRVMEDPATGSASAALGALLASLDPAPDRHLRLLVRQGVESGRPSLIEVSAKKRGGEVAEIVISGRCIQAMNGALML